MALPLSTPLVLSLLLLLLLLLSPRSTAAVPTAACAVSGLAAREHATGVGAAVQLQWQHLAGSEVRRGATQVSFQLEVSGGGLHWRSGVVSSAVQRVDTADHGLQLPRGADIRWNVLAVLSTGHSVACSGTLETAPAASAFPGAAKWIGGRGGQLHANKGLVLPGEATITRARALVSGVGSYYLYINGQRVGNNVMDPPQSVYSRRVLYQTHDVASLLRPGRNTVDAILGNYKWG